MEEQPEKKCSKITIKNSAKELLKVISRRK
jgi:hypothetical protein